MDYKSRVTRLEEAFHDFEKQTEAIAKSYHIPNWQTGVRSFHDIAGTPLFSLSSALLSLRNGSSTHDKGLLESAEKRVNTLATYLGLMNQYPVYGALEIADIQDKTLLGAFTDLRELRTKSKRLDVPGYVQGSKLRLTSTHQDIGRMCQPEFQDYQTLFSAGDMITDYMFDVLTLSQQRGITSWHAFLHVKANKIFEKSFPVSDKK